MTIYHIAWASDWEHGQSGGLYRSATLEIEGFIHATRERDDLLWVANQFFRDRRTEPLLVIALEEEAVGSPVRDEDPGCGKLFPHIYGPIDLQAIRGTETLQWSGGAWQFA